eukprot:8904038-Pyramimonas_sp.AAC.1
MRAGTRERRATGASGTSGRQPPRGRGRDLRAGTRGSALGDSAGQLRPLRHPQTLIRCVNPEP